MSSQPTVKSTAMEALSFSEKDLRAADKNKDGDLTREEFATYVSEASSGAIEEETAQQWYDEQIKDLSKDGSKTVDLDDGQAVKSLTTSLNQDVEEFIDNRIDTELLGDDFEDMDNRDTNQREGFISHIGETVHGSILPRDKVEQIYDEHDKNGDGLDAEEYKSASKDVKQSAEDHIEQSKGDGSMEQIEEKLMQMFMGMMNMMMIQNMASGG